MTDTVSDAGILAAFETLRSRLPRIWAEIERDPGYRHTSVIVPSLSVDQDELRKVVGASCYEERLLFALIRLRNPNARLVYVTSTPVHPDIIDYYLDLLEGVSPRHARGRLHVLSVYDSSPRPLTEKLLERPRFLERLRRLVDDPDNAYLTCYNSTPLERRLAVALDLPLNGLDPALLDHGTKSGGRRVFRDAGVRFPDGAEDLENEDDVVRALLELGQRQPQLEKAVVKLNEGFGGEGNGVFTFPAARNDDRAVRDALNTLHWTSGIENRESFMQKFEIMGGVVESLVVAEEVRSPSVQMRITPAGTPTLVSSHEQVLGGATGQSYLGCRFPADDDYRDTLQREAQKVGEVLAERGVIGRFGIDFLVGRNQSGDWMPYAIEINLRMGGTTPPFHALEFLTGGTLDRETGLFYSTQGRAKYYSATDNLRSPAYRGLLPEDLFDIIAQRGLGFSHASGSGTLFHMIGALSQYGKIGVTCIADSPEAAAQLFETTTRVLDEESVGEGRGRPGSLGGHGSFLKSWNGPLVTERIS